MIPRTAESRTDASAVTSDTASTCVARLEAAVYLHRRRQAVWDAMEAALVVQRACLSSDEDDTKTAEDIRGQRSSSAGSDALRANWAIQHSSASPDPSFLDRHQTALWTAYITSCPAAFHASGLSTSFLAAEHDIGATVSRRLVAPTERLTATVRRLNDRLNRQSQRQLNHWHHRRQEGWWTTECLRFLCRVAEEESEQCRCPGGIWVSAEKSLRRRLSCTTASDESSPCCDEQLRKESMKNRLQQQRSKVLKLLQGIAIPPDEATVHLRTQWHRQVAADRGP